MPKLATRRCSARVRCKIGEVLETEPGGLKGIIPVAGIMPALVPGMVDAGLVALRDFGTKSFNEMIEPAIELADGFAIDEMRANTIADSRQFFELWPTSKAHFLPNGQMPRVGEIFRQPDLARTLRVHGGGGKESAGRGREPPGGHRRGARLFLSRRNRAQDRRIHESQRRPAAL